MDIELQNPYESDEIDIESLIGETLEKATPKEPPPGKKRGAKKGKVQKTDEAGPLVDPREIGVPLSAAKKVEAYGKVWDADMPLEAIELVCLRYRHKQEDGGLGHAGHLKRVMQMLWPEDYAGEVEPGFPKWREDVDRLVAAWCSPAKVIVVCGHASAAKTHTLARIAVAEYAASPDDTIVTLTSTHLGGLKTRIWAEVAHAVKSQAYPALDAHVTMNDLKIRPKSSRSEQKYAICGVATDKTESAVEKIQGNHSRRGQYLIIDEAAGTGKSVFDAAANLMTDPDFKMVLLANPVRRNSEFGSWAMPVGGWDRINPDADLEWETDRGALALRFDGLRSPNVVAGRKVYPFLIDQEYVDNVARSYGSGSARYWAYVRGWFPPDGLLETIFPTQTIDKCRAPLLLEGAVVRIAAWDPAFEGDNNSPLIIAEYGRVAGEGGPSVGINLIKKVELRVPVIGDGTAVDPYDVRVAKFAKEVLKREGIDPKNFIMDATGGGRGVAAMLQMEYGRNIEVVQFGQAATDRPAHAGESLPSCEVYDRFVSELWFSARVFADAGMVGGMGGQAWEGLRDDLTQREYDTVNGKKIRIETKKEFKAVHGRSPDDGDAFVMLIELLRRRGILAEGTIGGFGIKQKVGEFFRKFARKCSAAVDPRREYRTR